MCVANIVTGEHTLSGHSTSSGHFLFLKTLRIVLMVSQDTQKARTCSWLDKLRQEFLSNFSFVINNIGSPPDHD